MDLDPDEPLDIYRFSLPTSFLYLLAVVGAAFLAIVIAKYRQALSQQQELQSQTINHEIERFERGSKGATRGGLVGDGVDDDLEGISLLARDSHNQLLSSYQNS